MRQPWNHSCHLLNTKCWHRTLGLCVFYRNIILTESCKPVWFSRKRMLRVMSASKCFIGERHLWKRKGESRVGLLELPGDADDRDNVSVGSMGELQSQDCLFRVLVLGENGRGFVHQLCSLPGWGLSGEGCDLRWKAEGGSEVSQLATFLPFGQGVLSSRGYPSRTFPYPPHHTSQILQWGIALGYNHPPPPPWTNKGVPWNIGLRASSICHCHEMENALEQHFSAFFFLLLLISSPPSSLFRHFFLIVPSTMKI